MRHFGALLVTIFLAFTGSVTAQTTINAADLPLKSSGVADGTAWTMDSNGYVGTYLRLDAPANVTPGEVTFTIRAAGHVNGGAAPKLRIVVADFKETFDVADQPHDYTLRCTLPPGIYFVRADFSNDVPAADRTLTFHSLAVAGAEVIKEHTDANALAVADTYIENFRKVPVKVRLADVPAGTKVQVKLKRHAFNFGTVAPNVSTNTVLIDNPPADSEAYKFQQYVTTHFNLLVPGNAGKWSSNEEQRGKLTLGYLDEIRKFAKEHNMRMRMHTLLWNDDQMPNWAKELLNRAANGDERAKKELREAISQRIDYYVRQRAASYVEMDILNEGVHKPWIYTLYGPAGLAEIHNEVAKAAADAGAADMLLCPNEFNILQWSSNPITRLQDDYANWYREHLEAIINAGGEVGGIGVQYYVGADANAVKNRPHSAARILQVFQNLAVTGRPIVLSEFGVSRGRGEIGGGPELPARFLGETMRMVLGTPGSTGFVVWGIRKPWLWDQADYGALLDENWQSTEAGQMYEKLWAQWHTELVATVDSDRRIAFRGFRGEYELLIDGKTRGLTVRGETAEPASRPAD